MAVTVTHTTAATGVDAGDGTISKNAWNEAHTVVPSSLPGYEYDYVEFTSNVAPTATTAATANTVITGSAVAYDGSTIVRVEFYSPLVRADLAAGRTMTFELYDGSTDIGALGAVGQESANAGYVPISVVRRLTPSAATHTYSVRAWVSAGTGVVGAGAGGAGTNFPGFIRITKV